jgi:hypothetical protein
LSELAENLWQMDYQALLGHVSSWVLTLGTFAIAALLIRSGRKRSRQALLPHATLRGWQNVTHFAESVVPWTMPGSLQTSSANIAGIWKGRRAEIVNFEMSEGVGDWTMAAVECTRVPHELGPVTAMDPKYPYGTGRRVGASARSELGRRFLLSGEDQDLQTVFSPSVEKAILNFPRRINQVMFDAKAASVTWYGREQDRAIVDAALDLAVIICSQVEASWHV